MFERSLIKLARARGRHAAKNSASLLNRIGEVIEQKTPLSETEDILSLFDLLDGHGELDAEVRKRLIESLMLDAERASTLRFMRGEVNSLWGVTPIINIIPYAKADRLLGVNAKTLVYTNYHVESKFDYNLKLEVEWLLQHCPEKLQAFGWMVFYWALLKFDIFHFYNDRGLLWDIGGYGSSRFGISLQEMQIIRGAGKRLYTYNYGADHRMRHATLAMGQYNFCTFCTEIGKHCVCDDDGGMQMLQTIKQYANTMCAGGLAILLMPWARDMNHLVIDLDEPKFNLQKDSRSFDGVLRIAHVPNHSFFKGTHFLEQAIEQLKSEGYSIEYVKLSGVPNEQVIELMRSSDLVADQFISGAYGYTAIEAFALGKPVLCYLRDELPLPGGEKPPVIQAHPEHIADVLRNVFENFDQVGEIQGHARQYVERHYSIEAFSQRLRDMYLETAGFPGYVNRILLGKTHSVRGQLGRLKLLKPLLRIEVNKRPRLKDFLRSIWHCFMQAAWLGRKVVLLGRKVALRSMLGFSWVILELAVFIGRLMTKWRFRTGKIRTLWGVTPILTLPLLARCDRLLGFRSDSLVFVTYVITQNFDINLSRWQAGILEKAPILYVPFLRMVLAYALIRYDVFHYFYDRGILAPKGRMGIHPDELELLRRTGKALFTYAYGADVRLRETTLALGKYNLCVECPDPGRFCICDENEGRKNVAQIAQVATAMISMGDMLSYVPGATNMHYWPIDTDKIKYVGVRKDWGMPTLRIAHAPNHSHFKGTKYLLDAVELLKQDGFAIEILFIQGVPNHKVIELYSQADLVADQFTAGFHGYAALEAMALGKPVLCYLRGPEMIVDSSCCPIINVDPDGLYLMLKDILQRKLDLEALGEASRAYVEKYYSIPAIASRLAAIYQEKLVLSEKIKRNLEKITASIV